MPVDFSGKYEFVRSEGLEEFLKKVDAPFMVKKMAPKAKPKMDITQKGDNFVIKMETPVKTETLNFNVGEEKEHENLKGDKMIGKSSWDGDKLVVDLRPKTEGKGIPQTHTRELNGDELTLTMECEDVTCKRVFKKV